MFVCLQCNSAKGIQFTAALRHQNGAEHANLSRQGEQNVEELKGKCVLNRTH